MAANRNEEEQLKHNGTSDSAVASSSSTSSELFARLGPPLNDKERKARERILADRYDVDAWDILANEAQLRPVSEATPIYEQLLAIFPTAAKYWKLYVEAQMVAIIMMQPNRYLVDACSVAFMLVFGGVTSVS